MEPVAQPPDNQRQTAPTSSRERMRRPLTAWVLALGPALVYIALSLLPISPTSVAGRLWSPAQPVYMLVVAVLIWRSITQANPRALRDALRSRTMRRILAAVALMTVGMIGLGIGVVFFGLSGGPAVVVLSIVVFGSLGFFFLALFLGLLDASKRDVDRYLSEHTRSASDM